MKFNLPAIAAALVMVLPIPATAGDAPTFIGLTESSLRQELGAPKSVIDMGNGNRAISYAHIGFRFYLGGQPARVDAYTVREPGFPIQGVEVGDPMSTVQKRWTGYVATPWSRQLTFAVYKPGIKYSASMVGGRVETLAVQAR